MSLNPSNSMGERDIRYEFADFAVYPSRLCLLYKLTMVNNINNFGVINFFNADADNKTTKKTAVEDIPVVVTQEKSTSVPHPRENNYNDVREYIEKRKKCDQHFKYYCETHNRKELCEYLSKEFGWIVDDHSLGANINRH